MTATEIGDKRDLDRQVRRMLRREPDSLRFAEFADYLRRQGRVAEARALCERGLARHPGYATGQVVMGEILRDQEDPAKAEEMWLEALRLDPLHPRAHLRLAELYLRRGDVERAVAAIETVLLVSPGLPEAQALAESAQGEVARAARPEAPGAAQRPARPAWLTAERFEELVGVVENCSAVQSVALVNAGGLALAGGVAACADPAGAAAAVAELMGQAGRLLTLIGGGLRGATICCRLGPARCVPLGDLTLLALMEAGAQLGSFDVEIGEAIARLAARGEPARDRGSQETEEVDGWVNPQTEREVGGASTVR